MKNEIMYGNNLILRFIGGDPDYCTTYYRDSKSCLRDKIDNRSKSEGLMFYSSWDWLMPVVQQIEKIKGARIIIDGYGCEVYSFGKILNKNSVADTKIEAVWLAVVDFIKWHKGAKDSKPELNSTNN